MCLELARILYLNKVMKKVVNLVQKISLDTLEMDLCSNEFIIFGILPHDVNTMLFVVFSLVT